MIPRKPRIALVLGDPAGIGPELAARLLADPTTSEVADVLVIADPRELALGMQIAGCHTALSTVASLDAARRGHGLMLLTHAGSTPLGFKRAASTAEAGAYALGTLKTALEAATVFGDRKARAVDLALAGFAAQLGGELVDLAQAGGADRMAFAL